MARTRNEFGYNERILLVKPATTGAFPASPAGQKYDRQPWTQAN